MKLKPIEACLMYDLKNKSSILAAICVIAFSLSTKAQTSATDEIADESITSEAEVEVVKTDVVSTISQKINPQTDSQSGVLSRKLTFSGRYAIDLDNGSFPDELIRNSRYSMIRFSKYLNEDYSFGIGYRGRYGGLTQYAEQLSLAATPLDFTRTPEPEKSGFVSFGYNLFYGKVSLTKNTVMTTLSKIQTDFGVQNFGSVNRPFIQTALVQNFFLSRYLALGFNVGFGFSEITDPTSFDVRVSQPTPNEASFSSKIQFNRYYGINLNLFL